MSLSIGIQLEKKKFHNKLFNVNLVKVYDWQVLYSYLSHRIIDSIPRIKTSFVSPEGPKAQFDKTSISLWLLFWYS